jgi:hypothetical protein
MQFEPTNAQEREILAFLNKHPKITYADVAVNCSASEWKRTNFLRKLRRDGLLKPCGRDGQTQYFTVFSTAQTSEFAANKRGVKEGAMWQAMRILKTFTVADLKMSLAAGGPELSEKQIQTYCSLLVTVKYLKVLKSAKIDKAFTRYQLIKDTGPLPLVRRQIMVVKDSNMDKIIYAQGERL